MTVDTESEPAATDRPPLVDLVDLGRVMRQARRARSPQVGRRQADVAREAGVNQKVVAKAERGDPVMSPGLFRVLAVLFPRLAQVLSALVADLVANAGTDDEPDQESDVDAPGTSAYDADTRRSPESHPTGPTSDASDPERSTGGVRGDQSEPTP